jgi:hypothetical protein
LTQPFNAEIVTVPVSLLTTGAPVRVATHFTVTETVSAAASASVLESVTTTPLAMLAG